ncbi:hypothetical protein Ddc_20711 [Ditylenchus destructor]|nr:hypothetical protein Ddc_20711 [Ditylenchus destructor]
MNATLPNMFDESCIKRFNKATSRFQYQGHVYGFSMTRAGFSYWRCAECQASLRTSPSGNEVFGPIGSHNHAEVPTTRPDGTFEQQTWNAFGHSRENFTLKTDAKPAIKYLKMTPTEVASETENAAMTSKSHNVEAKKEPKGLNLTEKVGRSPHHSNSNEALDNFLLPRSTDQERGMHTPNDQESDTTTEANEEIGQSRSSGHINMSGQRTGPEFTETSASVNPHSRIMYGGNDVQIVKQYVNAMCASQNLAKTQSKVPAGYPALSLDHPKGYRLTFMGSFLCSMCQQSLTPCHLCPQNPKNCGACCKHEFRIR